MSTKHILLTWIQSHLRIVLVCSAGILVGALVASLVGYIRCVRRPVEQRRVPMVVFDYRGKTEGTISLLCKSSADIQSVQGPKLWVLYPSGVGPCRLFVKPDSLYDELTTIWLPEDQWQHIAGQSFPLWENAR